MDTPTPLPVILVAHSGAELYGADRVLLESVAGLRRRGTAVFVTLPVPGPLVAELERLGAEVRICRVPVLRKSSLTVAGLLKLGLGFATGAVRGFQLIRAVRPAAIYVNTVTIPLWPFLGRLLGRPVLVHVHEAERTAAMPLRVALALPLVFSSSIVANSRYSATTLGQTLPLLLSRGTVIYNGVQGPPAVVPPRAQLAGPFRLLYVGRLSARKGVHTAIDAVAKARARGLDVHLDIVGAVFPGYEWYGEQLRAQVGRLDLGAAVSFHGFAPSVWDFLAACDAVVVPSGADEPFGDTAVEAVLAARPAIVSRTPGLGEAVGGFASVQFTPVGDSEAVATALLQVHAGWRRFSEDALADAQLAARRYSPSRFGQEICAAVDQLLQ